MTSVNTNAAALTALRTLQATNSAMDATQNRISTGYKIGEAKDNAAYWSISTTLKSDNKSLSTVKDALGLGAATVDVAYEGLNSAKDVLDEIQKKLTSATQDGLNKDTIQKEIGELQKQLKSIANSSVFSGENWLSVDSSVVSYNSIKQVVGSFSRDMSGAVSIDRIDVDISKVALFDASNAAGAGGLLDGKVQLTSADGRVLNYGGTGTSTGNTSKAGLAAGTDTGTTALALKASGSAGTQATVNLGSFTSIPTGSGTFSTAAGTDPILTIAVDVNGTTRTVELLKSELVTANTADAANITVDEAIAAFNVDTVATTNNIELFLDGTDVKIRHKNAGELNTLAGAIVTPAAAITAGIATPGSTSAYVAGTGEAKVSTSGLNLSGLLSTDQIDMTFKFDGVEKTVRVDPAAMTAAGIRDWLNNTASAADFSNHAVASVVNGELVITGRGVGTGQTVELTKVSYLDSTNAVKEPTAATGLPYAEQAKVVTAAFDGAMALDTDDKIQFDLKLNGAATSTLITIDKATVESAVAGSGGVIANASNYAAVLTKAFANAGVTGITASAPATGADAGKVVFTTTLRDATAKIDISNVTATNGAKEISVSTIDISNAKLAELGATTADQVKSVLSAYISIVASTIDKVTSAAANLGSAASRIEMQTTFVNTLMDTIDKGVGNLIDADMSEESTKLQALQVKQQLGVQALSIANQSAQQLLRLFQ